MIIYFDQNICTTLVSVLMYQFVLFKQIILISKDNAHQGTTYTCLAYLIFNEDILVTCDEGFTALTHESSTPIVRWNLKNVILSRRYIRAIHERSVLKRYSNTRKTGATLYKKTVRNSYNLLRKECKKAHFHFVL